jgi:probable HAF family extracellular repeat protein
MRLVMGAVLAGAFLVAGCDGPTRPFGTPGESQGIRKGTCFDPCIIVTAVEYAATITATDLGTLPGDVASVARDVNDAGQIVGESIDANNTPRAVIWNTPAPIKALTTLGGTRSSARGINTTGVVTGWSTTPSGQQDGFVWNAGAVLDLKPVNAPKVPYFVSAERLIDVGTAVGYVFWPLGAINSSMAYWPAGSTIATMPYLAPGKVGAVGLDINGAGMRVVFAGAKNFDAKMVDIASLGLNKTQASYNSIQDVNGDGTPDLVMLFSMRQLIANGSLTLRTTQVTITGNLMKIGTPLTDTWPVKICLNQKDCPTDDTVAGP